MELLSEKQVEKQLKRIYQAWEKQWGDPKLIATEHHGKFGVAVNVKTKCVMILFNDIPTIYGVILTKKDWETLKNKIETLIKKEKS